MSKRVKIEERLPEVRSAKGGEPLNANEHTYWTLDKKKNIRDKQQRGYRYATEGEIIEFHDGYVDVDGHVRNGDLVLMIGPVEVEEKKERDRRELDLRLEGKMKEQEMADGGGAIYDNEEHKQIVQGKVHHIS